MALLDFFKLPTVDYTPFTNPGAAAAPGAAPVQPDNPSPMRTIAQTPAYLLASDVFVGIDTTVPRMIYLPAGAPAGTQLIIKDISGLAGANPITVLPQGADLIDGAVQAVITSNFGRRVLVKDAGNGAQLPQWRVLIADAPSVDNPFVHRRVLGGSVAPALLLATDTLVSVDSSKGAATLYLPQNPPQGTLIAVEDVGGSAAASPILVTFGTPGSTNFFETGSPVPIVGNSGLQGTDVIAANAGKRMYYFDGVAWNVLFSSVNTITTRAQLPVGATLLTSDDNYVPFNGSLVSVANLPANPRPGQVVTFKETAGASTGSLTINPGAGQKIQQHQSASNLTTLLIAASGETALSTPLALFLALPFVYDAITQTWFGLPAA